MNNLTDIISGLLAIPSGILGALSVLRAVVGSVLLLFLPGFGWTLVFFRKVNLAERCALSFGLSIALVTLSLLSLNLLAGMRLTGLNAVLVAIVLSAVPLLIYLFRRLAKSRARGEQDG